MMFLWIGEIMKCYRCGYCGQPTDENGNVLSIDEINAMEVDWDTAELVEGYCCYYELQEQEHQQRITRDMALDAGYPEMEGQEW